MRTVWQEVVDTNDGGEITYTLTECNECHKRVTLQSSGARDHLGNPLPPIDPEKVGNVYCVKCGNDRHIRRQLGTL